MNHAKAKRIKKLKKTRIWPSLLGAFIILISFCVLIVFGIVAFILDIFSRKCVDGYTQANKVMECYAEEKNNDTISWERIENVMRYADNVEDFCIFEPDGTVLYKSGDKIPDYQQIVNGEYCVFSDGKLFSYDLWLDIEQDVEPINLKKSTVMKIAEEIFTLDNLLSKKKSIYELRGWYFTNIDSELVCVHYKSEIFVNDFITALVIILCIGTVAIISLIYYVVSMISLVKKQRQTTKILYTDMITGGDNWLYFEKKATKLIKNNKNYAMVHLRMGQYRSFCTCFGVSKGEELIERIYGLLHKYIKKKEVMAHNEKAEFGLLLCYSDRETFCARLQALEQEISKNIPNIKLRFKFGVCEVDSKLTDVEVLYNNAVLAREILGNDEQNIAFFDEAMSKQRIWERKVEDDMERALNNREFQVYLQPKISTGTEKLGGAEALVRWIHPTEGFVPPNRFIPIFENNGFILKLDDYMLEEVASQQAKWIAEGKQVVPISVNVSRAHFTREDLAEHICEIVDRYQVPHDVIELELTESAFFDDKETLLSTVKKLRDTGFSVSMDDFGAGYSSLNSLKELSIDVLKIDADFFRGADSLERGMLIVSEVIDLAKKLDMKIVAEGIESKEQVEFLTAQECDLIQGYYYAKPMPLAEFEQKYNQN